MRRYELADCVYYVSSKGRSYIPAKTLILFAPDRFSSTKEDADAFARKAGWPVAAEKDGAVLTFENVLLQKVSFSRLDQNGYMIYNVLTGSFQEGYYLTNGEAVRVVWKKYGGTANGDRTSFHVLDENGNVMIDANGNAVQIQVNAGKTYIGLVPEDTWGNLAIR